MQSQALQKNVESHLIKRKTIFTQAKNTKTTTRQDLRVKNEPVGRTFYQSNPYLKIRQWKEKTEDNDENSEVKKPRKVEKVGEKIGEE